MPRYQKTNATVLGTQMGNMIGGSGTVSFRPVVIYRYQVNGQDYTGDKLHQQPIGTRNRRVIQRMLGHYPQGSNIEIYYNVKRPEDSFIKKGRPPVAGFVITALLIIMIIVLITLALFFFAPELLASFLS